MISSLTFCVSMLDLPISRLVKQKKTRSFLQDDFLYNTCIHVGVEDFCYINSISVDDCNE